MCLFLVECAFKLLKIDHNNIVRTSKNSEKKYYHQLCDIKKLVTEYSKSFKIKLLIFFGSKVR